MIRFIADIFQKQDWAPEFSSSANLSNDSEGQILSEFYCGDYPTDSYWLDWGGSYDNPTTTNLQVYFEQFLQKVSDIETLIATENSFMASGDYIYTNTTYYPWQYASAGTEIAISFGYSSAPVDPAFPSNHEIEDEDGGVQDYPVRLEIPSISNKLSDPISGTALYSTFSFTLNNEDGAFDKTSDTELFNVPVYISKATADNPTKEDYTVIRYGAVDNMAVKKTQFIVTGADIFRTLDEDVCSVVSTDDYPDAPDASVDTNIPVAYGSITGAPLIEVGDDEWIVCDPDYLDSVTSVYDSDGTSLSFSVTDGVITATDAATCDFTGGYANSIGAIITKEMEDKSNLAYEEGVWDATETDSYIGLSANINLFYDGDSVKDLVTTCLQSDNAFLISKNDGRLTLRQWGQIYTTHILDADNLTASTFPSKKFLDSKYYGNAVKISYDYNQGDGVYDMTFLDDSRAASISEVYNKKTTLPFETLLTSEADAEDLAGRLLDRFGKRPEIYTLSTGDDTSGINLLDTIEIDLTINGRELSDVKLFTVKAVNVSQDVLTIEESGETYYNKYDGLLAEPGNINYDGLLSETPGLLASIPSATEED